MTTTNYHRAPGDLSIATEKQETSSHGVHVTAGLIWLVVMMAQVAFKGFRPAVQRRLQCFSLFWHALDIIWVGLFTVVYLMGVSS